MSATLAPTITSPYRPMSEGEMLYRGDQVVSDETRNWPPHEWRYSNTVMPGYTIGSPRTLSAAYYRTTRDWPSDYSI